MEQSALRAIDLESKVNQGCWIWLGSRYSLDDGLLENFSIKIDVIDAMKMEYLYLNKPVIFAFTLIQLLIFFSLDLSNDFICQNYSDLFLFFHRIEQFPKNVRHWVKIGLL
jgi:hypothetical protein